MALSRRVVRLTAANPGMMTGPGTTVMSWARAS